MSRSGHLDPADAELPPGLMVASERVLVARPLDLDRHAHASHELLWGTDGRRTVQTDENAWLVPPALGIWIPAGVSHSGWGAANTIYFSTLFHPSHCSVAFTDVTPIVISPVLREMLLHVHARDLAADERARAEAVIVDLISPAEAAMVRLPMPADARARRVAQALIEHPDDDRTLAMWGRETGAASRTLNRIFSRQTGLSLVQWRTHARIRAALPLLASGRTVTQVGREVGYQTASSFVRAFRHVTGQTPGTYIAHHAVTTTARFVSEELAPDVIKS